MNGEGERRQRSWGALACIAGAALAASCSGEAGEEEPWWIQSGQGSDLPSDDIDSGRFLHQATFGPVDQSIAALEYAGFEAWFRRQLRLAPTLTRPRLEAREAAGESIQYHHRMEEWWYAAVHGRDQLRQRMAFALSQILVISDSPGTLRSRPVGVAEYYDVLVRGALGNYRDLIGDVTKSPAMGFYLSHLRNQKGDPSNGISPDENYARELTQLFTLGLVELEMDGSVRLDSGGQEIPTFTQTDIEELSRVLTGWTYAGSANFLWGPVNLLEPMEAWPEHHDDGAKTIIGGAVIPAGLTPEEDLDAALDVIFGHPNIAPFICYRLIQRLVTSNPSPAYVARVSAVFEDDGTGERGDLFEVAKAILMDSEARQGHIDSPATFGKLREPVVRLAGLWRSFKGRADTGRYRFWFPEREFGQGALRAPSVFNFFYPDHKPAGPISDADLVAPEFQITTHTNITNAANVFHDQIYRAYQGYQWGNENTVTLHLGAELALADDAPALIDRLNTLLMGGVMSADMRQILIGHVEGVDMEAGGRGTGMQRVLDAIYLIVTSPEGSMQL